MVVVAAGCLDNGWRLAGHAIRLHHHVRSGLVAVTAGSIKVLINPKDCQLDLCLVRGRPAGW